MSIAAAIEEMIAEGFTPAQAIRAAKIVEAHMAAPVDNRSVQAKRQARYRERRQASQSVTDVTPRDASVHRNGCDDLASQSVTDVTPYARVEDSSTNLETSIKGKKERNAREKKRHVGDAFARFWSAWPNKVQKPYAEKCFTKVADQIEDILVGVEKYMRRKPPDRPWLNPSTFLNQHRWRDEPAQTTTGTKSNGKGSIVEAGRKLTERLIAAERERELQAVNRVDDGDPSVRFLPPLGGKRS